MIPVFIFLLIIFSVLLIKSADFVIVAIRRISRRTKTAVFTLSAILLALGTSFPELFVGITSALEEAPSLSLGVIIGSNIANISLIAGLTAFLVGKVYVHGNFLKRDVWIALVAGILPIFLVIDGELGRVDGLVLLATYGAYASSFFRERFIQIGEEQREENFFYRFLRKFSHIDTEKTKEYGRLFLGIALLLFSADMIVRISGQLALAANIPVFVIGLIIVAVGTSLPELAFSLRSLEDHQPSMFFGNLLGSTIANSTLVIGIVGLINPIEVVAVNQYLIAAAAFLLIFVSFWHFISTKHRLDRWEASALLLLYFLFLIVEF
jgi:cation:H+ antiporter